MPEACSPDSSNHIRASFSGQNVALLEEGQGESAVTLRCREQHQDGLRCAEVIEVMKGLLFRSAHTLTSLAFSLPTSSGLA